MRPLTVLSIVTLTTLLAAACSKEEAAKPGAPASAAAPAAKAAPGAPAAEGELAKIPIIPGYKYYVGGPVMKKDAYGSYRLTKFNGEVEQPPSRGMIFGAKREGDTLEYKVWGNGVLLGLHRGIMRDDVFWEEYAEGYRQGKLIAREKRVNDDAVRRSKITTEDIDPETGEVIRTREASVSYLPMAGLDEDEDEEEGGGGGNMVPAPGVKEVAPPAPAEPGKDPAH